MLKRIQQALLARKRRRTAIRMMVLSGVLRSSYHTIRYAMTPRQLKILLREDEE
jgi:hypothetical protein